MEIKLKKSYLTAAVTAGLALAAVSRWSAARIRRKKQEALYALDQIRSLEHSPLKGRHIVFLGSSVTYGSASGGVSIADYLAARHSFFLTKEAVSGTTLVDEGDDSYVSRLKGLDRQMEVDMLICQLSTNDASRGKPLGAVAGTRDVGSFDTSTVAGAVEYIIGFARETWNCPVLFYTNPRYQDSRYGKMAELLEQIAAKWEIRVIDMWNDPLFPKVTWQQRQQYMADSIHPTRAGYLRWWLPYWEKILCEEGKRT